MGSLGRILRSYTKSTISRSVISVPSDNPSPSSWRKPESLARVVRRMWINNIKPTEQINIDALHHKFAMERKKFLCSFSSLSEYCRRFVDASGKSMCRGTIVGITIAGTMATLATDAYAMDGRDILAEHCTELEPVGFLKEDLYNFWALAKKFQLPAILLLMVLLGWRHPITLAINVILLLSCTRPSPYSVYIFIEQFRKQAMQRDPGLSKSKLFYARKVDVEDYKLLCTAKIELKDRKLNLIGILGSWWILQCSKL